MWPLGWAQWEGCLYSHVARFTALVAVAVLQAWGVSSLDHYCPSQEKERNARRKKKKTPAAASEETAFPPAAEDEEMEASGASANEEELAEEVEGEVTVLSREGSEHTCTPCFVSLSS